MIQLENLKAGISLVGIEPTLIATVVAVVPIGDGAVQLLYKTPEGTIKDRLLGRADEASISLATAERPWAFDGNGDDFKLAVEDKRIDLAFLFDPMMAVHTSNVDALPHQITAVYESMLPRQPLRFVLADDPGAGKTIMAGLYIRELIMRADARRILFVAPGSLVEQWRDELFEKFGLEFRIFSKELEVASPSGNPFEDHDHLIVRLDQMSRNEESQEKLCLASWDLVVFDEAHKLSAHFFGREIKRTKRFNFAEKIGQHTRHLLLMTATPHNGKEEDFQLCGVRVVSLESWKVVEAETVHVVEGRACAVAKRDGDAPPGSWTASRTKGRRRNPGGPAGAIGMVADGGGARGRTEALRRAEVGSRIGPYY